MNEEYLTIEEADRRIREVLDEKLSAVSGQISDGDKGAGIKPVRFHA